MFGVALKPMGRVIDGSFIARGQWANVTSSKTLNGFFVATVFVRGGGQGGGGDADVNGVYTGSRKWGRGGSHGLSATHAIQHVCDAVVTIGTNGARGVDDYYVTAWAKSGTDGEDGGTTTIAYGSITRTALGGSSFGDGGYANSSPPPASSAFDPLAYSVTGNPNGGNYGRMGGRFTGPGSYSSSNAGVVQLQLID
jgi:hypothetical protein